MNDPQIDRMIKHVQEATAPKTKAMTQLDLAAIRALPTGNRGSRPRKLTSNQRLAIYAFAKEGVPPVILAKVFGVQPNAIYYINNESTAANELVRRRYEALGKRVWSDIVTKEQMNAVNEAVRKEASPW